MFALAEEIRDIITRMERDLATQLNIELLLVVLRTLRPKNAVTIAKILTIGERGPNRIRKATNVDAQLRLSFL